MPPFKFHALVCPRNCIICCTSPPHFSRKTLNFPKILAISNLSKWSPVWWLQMPSQSFEHIFSTNFSPPNLGSPQCPLLNSSETEVVWNLMTFCLEKHFCCFFVGHFYFKGTWKMVGWRLVIVVVKNWWHGLPYLGWDIFWYFLPTSTSVPSLGNEITARSASLGKPLLAIQTPQTPRFFFQSFSSVTETASLTSLTLVQSVSSWRFFQCVPASPDVCSACLCGTPTEYSSTGCTCTNDKKTHNRDCHTTNS